MFSAQVSLHVLPVEVEVVQDRDIRTRSPDIGSNSGSAAAVRFLASAGWNQTYSDSTYRLATPDSPRYLIH